MLDPPDIIYPRCPICGEECETVYSLRKTDEIIGCENCISENDADAMPECYPEKG
jgi:hypothetical protein